MGMAGSSLMDVYYGSRGGVSGRTGSSGGAQGQWKNPKSQLNYRSPEYMSQFYTERKGGMPAIKTDSGSYAHQQYGDLMTHQEESQLFLNEQYRRGTISEQQRNKPWWQPPPPTAASSGPHGATLWDALEIFNPMTYVNAIVDPFCMIFGCD